MPCAQFEALEACHQVRREQGVDSDKSTVDDNNDNNNNDAEDAGDPKGNRLSLRQESTRLLGHVQESPSLQPGSGRSLYNDQMITTLDILRDLTNNIIKELSRAIRKPGGDVTGH